MVLKNYLHIYFFSIVSCIIQASTAYAQVENNADAATMNDNELYGTVCQFRNAPKAEEVYANCTKFEPKPDAEKNEINSATYSFMAVSGGYTMNMLVEGEGCSSANISSFEWIIKEEENDEIYASGNLFNRQISGLTPGEIYTVTYNWRSTCRASSIYPYLVAIAPSTADYLSLTAEQEKENVRLKWSVISETNNNFFEIEKSTDNKKFTKISTVRSIGDHNGLVNYVAIDHQPLAGPAYYRLKQVDNNGAISYSKKVAINFANREDQLKVIPPLVKEEMYIKYFAEENDLIILRITNEGGDVVMSKPLNAKFGGLNLYNLEADDIKPGVYSAYLMRSDKSIITRFTKE